jgi:hypothetical protein
MVHELHEPIDKLTAFEIANLIEYDPSAKMFVAIGVTSGALQRALFRQLNRQARGASRQDALPCAEKFFRRHIFGN